MFLQVAIAVLGVVLICLGSIYLFLFRERWDDEEEDKKYKKKKRFSCIIIIIVGVLIFLSTFCFTIVKPGHTGVVVTLGKVNSNTLQEGIHLKVPVIQSVKQIDNRIVKLELDTESSSSDMQTVNTKVVVNYRVDKKMSYSVYQNIGIKYEEVIIAPSVPEIMKDIISKYNAEQCITTREEISDKIHEQLNAELNSRGIYIEAFNIIDLTFSEDYTKAIEEKQVAEQQLQKSKIDQEKAVVEANTEAQKVTIKAQSEADAKKIEAEGNRELSNSLSDNIIRYMMINKWNGELPKVQSDAGMLFDSSILNNEAQK